LNAGVAVVSTASAGRLRRRRCRLLTVDKEAVLGSDQQSTTVAPSAPPHARRPQPSQCRTEAVGARLGSPAPAEVAAVSIPSVGQTDHRAARSTDCRRPPQPRHHQRGRSAGRPAAGQTLRHPAGLAATTATGAAAPQPRRRQATAVAAALLAAPAGRSVRRAAAVVLLVLAALLGGRRRRRRHVHASHSPQSLVEPQRTLVSPSTRTGQNHRVGASRGSSTSAKALALSQTGSSVSGDAPRRGGGGGYPVDSPPIKGCHRNVQCQRRCRLASALAFRAMVPRA